MTHLKVFCWNIFERDLHVAQVFTFKSLSQIKKFLSHAVICDGPVRIGRSFMGTIALAIVGMSDN